MGRHAPKIALFDNELEDDAPAIIAANEAANNLVDTKAELDFSTDDAAMKKRQHIVSGMGRNLLSIGIFR